MLTFCNFNPCRMQYLDLTALTGVLIEVFSAPKYVEPETVHGVTDSAR